MEGRDCIVIIIIIISYSEIPNQPTYLKRKRRRMEEGKGEGQAEGRRGQEKFIYPTTILKGQGPGASPGDGPLSCGLTVKGHL